MNRRRTANCTPELRVDICRMFAICSLILLVEGRHSGWLLFGRGRNGVPAGPAQPAGLPGRLGHRSMGTMTCAQGACWTTGRRLRTGRQTTARGSEARSHEHRGGAPKGAGPRSQGDPDTLRKRVGPFAAAHGASQTPAPFGAPLPSSRGRARRKRFRKLRALRAAATSSCAPNGRAGAQPRHDIMGRVSCSFSDRSTNRGVREHSERSAARAALASPNN